MHSEKAHTAPKKKKKKHIWGLRFAWRHIHRNIKMPYKNAGDLRNSLPTSESYFHPETFYFIFCIQNAIDTTCIHIRNTEERYG